MQLLLLLLLPLLFCRSVCVSLALRPLLGEHML